jgi:hypothetical protein
MPSMSGGPRSHPQAGKWLAAAIVSIFCCAIVLGPVVWINTSIKLKEMDAQSGVVWTNRGTMNAARIVSIVSTVLGAVSIIYLATVR